MDFPPWVVLHIPHNSTHIPPSVRDQFLLSEHELQQELLRITDHHTLALFAAADTAARVVAAPVSRLVVDVERFASDAEEPMAARGMGAIYSTTSQNTPLRRTLTATEREALMQTWYYPHHARLEQAVDNALAEHSRCLVLDCHSFPDQPLPYEMANPAQQRPDICIGTDDFHTPAALTAALVEQFSRAGLNVKLNDPFAGALVPTNFYHQDKRASAVMIEVNRKLYLQGDTAVQCADFDELGKGIREACIRAIQKEEHMSTIQ